MELEFLLNEKRLWPMKEIFEQWQYVPPASPEKLLYDFYFITWAERTTNASMIGSAGGRYENVGYSLHEALETIVNTLKPHMIKAVGFCLAAELRHLFDDMSQFRQEYEAGTLKIHPDTLEFIKVYAYFLGKKLTRAGEAAPNYPDIPREDISGVYNKGFLAKQGEDERKSSYKAILRTIRTLKTTAYEYGMICDDAYRNVKWGGSYGGPKWADIGKAYAMLAEAKTTNDKIVWLDHVYDLQHNTDVVFNKLRFYYSGGYQWLKNALNWKADTSDMRDYYQRVSPSLKPIVAFVAKNIAEHGTMEDHPEDTSYHPAFRGMGEKIAWDKEGILTESELDMDKISIGSHKLYMSSCPLYNPPGGDPVAYIQKWIATLQSNNVRTIVCLLPKVDDLIAYYKDSGFEVIHYPIKDFGVPQDMKDFYRFIQTVAAALQKGNALVHCMGGYGRTGLIVACLLAFQGFDPDSAIKAVRKARKHTIETKEQEAFVEDFAIFADKLKSV